MTLNEGLKPSVAEGGQDQGASKENPPPIEVRRVVVGESGGTQLIKLELPTGPEGEGQIVDIGPLGHA